MLCLAMQGQLTKATEEFLKVQYVQVGTLLPENFERLVPSTPIGGVSLLGGGFAMRNFQDVLPDRK